MKELDKVYAPEKIEKGIYDYWTENDCFRAVIDPEKEPYTIVIPPPNITGQLHMGHALDNALQDAIIRRKRMQGYSALWLPGTDHASIATEAKIVAAMKEEGITKEDIGREAFLRRAWEWKEKYAGRIIEQLKFIGCSCDWSRLRFTLDEGCSRAVNTVFNKYYNEGIIYRGNRIVNWCPDCKTTISDAEVDFEEQESFLWHLRYPLVDSSGYIELATTRPETMLGDTAVAVNPNDKRYKNLIGKTVILPIVHREIPIVADDYVDMEFGTGAVKITPAHDNNDYEVGLRHNLPTVNIFTDGAQIIDEYKKYAGLDRYAARKAIVKDLDAEGALIRTEPYTHNVGCCYRCGSSIEPRISDQWFVKMDSLCAPALEAVADGRTSFIPERFAKVYNHWLEELHDWCISRQLWWGHRIPAWHCRDCGHITVAENEPKKCQKCGSANIHQDEDTLDTWFSSALWPFSTLGYPDDTEDLRYFYPTSTLVTGYDIIFFWVVRMMFSGLKHMGDVPFRTVVIHGLVRDALGRKMSKSLGNGIDPIEVVERYGADALRFSLINGISPGNDILFRDERILSSRNFNNKIWNASRFVLMNLPDGYEFSRIPDKLKIEDKWLLCRLNDVTKEVNENFEKMELGVVSQKLYSFFWDTYCDWYIEIAKPRLSSEELKKDVLDILVYALMQFLKLIHPIIPFITECIWQSVSSSGRPLMLEPYPRYDEAFEFRREERDFTMVTEAITAIRNIRSKMKISPSVKTKIYIKTDKPDIFKACVFMFSRLASDLECAEDFELGGQKLITVVTDSVSIFIPMSELIDIEKEIARLEAEREKVQSDIDRLNTKLSNVNFVSRAPAEVVAAEKEKLEAALSKLSGINGGISELM